jgi:hypothetical protein
MKLLHALGDEAACPGTGEVTGASFVAGALREISVGLCRGNFFMYRAYLGMFAKGRGSGLACVCPRMSMGCCRAPAWGGLFAMPRS